MIDTISPQGRVIAAALHLAAERPWGDVALLDIAQSAGISLAEMRTHFASKGEIVAAFARAIDDAVLAKASTRPVGQSARDTLFEVIMNRFDALTPHRKAMKSIYHSRSADPTFIRSFLSSQSWMLNAAGVSTDGIEGGLKVAGVASVYLSVFTTWLDDDDPGLARTMAALDRRLRRGERTMASIEEVTSAMKRMASIFSTSPRTSDNGPSASAPGTVNEAERTAT